MNNMAHTTGSSLTPIVHVRDGQVFANSRDVAEFFGKDHRRVLQDIREGMHGSVHTPSGWFVERLAAEESATFKKLQDTRRLLNGNNTVLRGQEEEEDELPFSKGSLWRRNSKGCSIVSLKNSLKEPPK